MTELLERAFAALGKAPTRREVILVANALWASEDEATLAALEAAATGGFSEFAEFAQASGSSAFTALDLLTDFGGEE